MLRLFLGLTLCVFFQSAKANATWDPYENLRIALGNWTPTPIFKIERTDETSSGYKFIKGSSTEIFEELEKKKAELFILADKIKQLKECQVQTCYKVVQDSNGTVSTEQISNIEINKSLDVLDIEFKSLDKFINYAENKLITELPKIKLALDVEILGGKTELRDLRDNVKNMITNGEITPIGRAIDMIEIESKDVFGGQTFQISGTLSEVANKLKEAKNQVSKTYENLTGIKAIFSEFGGGLTWDFSQATRPSGISEDSTPEEVDAYVALKELSNVNYVATNKIIEGALFKPVEQRTEFEKNVVQERLAEVKNHLYETIIQRESHILIAKEMYAKYHPGLVEEKNNYVEALQKLKNDPLATNEKIAAYEGLIKQKEERIASLQRQVEGKTYGKPIDPSNPNNSDETPMIWYDGNAQIIKERIDELQKLSPETAIDIINIINSAAAVGVEAAVTKHIYNTNSQDLQNAKNILIDLKENALNWQTLEVNAAKERIQSQQNYWNAQKDAVKENITMITNQYIEQGTDPVLAREWAESKFTGVVQNLEAQERTAIEGHTKWLDSLNSVDPEGISAIYKEKFGIDKIVEQVQTLEKTVAVQKDIMTGLLDKAATAEIK